MATLQEDIKKQSDWIVLAFKEDGYLLDYSIHSFLAIDMFLHKNLTNGKPKRGGRLTKNFGAIIFSISSYIAETLLRSIPHATLVTDDSDPQGEVNFSVVFGDNVCWPAQRVIKRIQHGLEDGIYPYGINITEGFVTEPFDEAYWEIGKEDDSTLEEKPWWKFW